MKVKCGCFLRKDSFIALTWYHISKKRLNTILAVDEGGMDKRRIEEMYSTVAEFNTGLSKANAGATAYCDSARVVNLSWASCCVVAT